MREKILLLLSMREHASLWFIAHFINCTEAYTHLVLKELEKEEKVREDKDGWHLT